MRMLKTHLEERGGRILDDHLTEWKRKHEGKMVNGYPAKPPMRWTKDENGRVLPLNSRAWAKLRKLVLSEEPLCRHCEARGVITPATEVDHMNGADDNRRESLQALCKPCHSLKTMAELYGRTTRAGCDATGQPHAADHHWNKSPAVDRPEPTGTPSFNANCEGQ